MLKEKTTLLLDAGINLVLGILLVVFNPTLVDSLGVPASSTRFYPSILGAVLIGIALALMVEALRPAKAEMIGLGLVGASCINLSGGLALAAWLLFGALTLPLRGKVLLWSLVGVLVVLSGLELLKAVRKPREAALTRE
jgi:hypothetical protein